jgi:hypothetical protein
MQNDLVPGTVFSSISFNGFSYRLGGNAIGLTGGVTVGMFGGGETIDLPITLVGDQTLSGDVRFNGPISGSGRVKSTYGGFGSPRFAGTHPFSGVLTGQVVLFNGSFPNASIDLPADNSQSFLGGFGTIGGPVKVSSINLASQYDPSHQLLLNVGSLTLGGMPFMSQLQVQINGADAGTGYGQVNVADGVTILPGTGLFVQLSPSYVPTAGDTHVIVQQGGATAVSGTFNGLPEGSVLRLNGVYDFRLSYAGGTGNDIVLVSLNGKNPTNTTLASSSNPSAPVLPSHSPRQSMSRPARLLAKCGSGTVAS